MIKILSLSKLDMLITNSYQLLRDNDKSSEHTEIVVYLRFFLRNDPAELVTSNIQTRKHNIKKVCLGKPYFSISGLQASSSAMGCASGVVWTNFKQKTCIYVT